MANTRTETYWRTLLGYRVIITKDLLDGGFVSEVPGLPGCFSQGDTLLSTLANTTNAIEGCLTTKAAENAGVVGEDQT